MAVKDHQQYQDAYQDCQDWLNSSRDKVEACADTSGDRVSIQNKLERLRVRICDNLLCLFYMTSDKCLVYKYNLHHLLDVRKNKIAAGGKVFSVKFYIKKGFL